MTVDAKAPRASTSLRELGLADVAECAARLRAKLARLEVPTEAGSDAAVFRNEGDIWTVRWAGTDVRLKDGKGPRYLATLLDVPGREVHVLQFAAPAPDAHARADGLSAGLPGQSLDDAPDERARRAYRARIEELRAELDEAEQFADGGRAERLRAELDQLVSQVAERFGSRTRQRGPAETARKAVTKVLRTQIGKLLDLHPALGRHLRDSVRMGTRCVYAPATPVAWDVAFARK